MPSRRGASWIHSCLDNVMTMWFKRKNLSNIFTLNPFNSVKSITKFIIWLAPWAGKMNRTTRWLATWAGKMELFCPLETTRCIPQEKFPRKPYSKSFIAQACSVRWLDIGLGSFLRGYGSRLRLDPETRRKRTWPISRHLYLTLGQ